jgi:hypothetical protein
MMRYLRAVSIPAAIVLQLCAAVAAPQVDRPTEAVAKPSTGVTPLISDTEINARVRKEVLGKLASELESRYVIEDTAKRLAELVRAKQKSNAYRSITTGPALARALTDDLLAVAHDKHLRVSFSFASLPQNPSGPLSQEVLNQIRKQNGAIPKVEILDGNVGYMRVNGVPSLDLAIRREHAQRAGREPDHGDELGRYWREARYSGAFGDCLEQGTCTRS